MPLFHEASMAVALGANQPSVAGSPRDTLRAVRPLLEQQVADGSSLPALLGMVAVPPLL